MNTESSAASRRRPCRRRHNHLKSRMASDASAAASTIAASTGRVVRNAKYKRRSTPRKIRTSPAIERTERGAGSTSVLILDGRRRDRADGCARQWAHHARDGGRDKAFSVPSFDEAGYASPMNVEDSYEGALRRLQRLEAAGLHAMPVEEIARDTDDRLRDLEELATLACEDNERLKQELASA